MQYFAPHMHTLDNTSGDQGHLQHVRALKHQNFLGNPACFNTALAVCET